MIIIDFIALIFGHLCWGILNHILERRPTLICRILKIRSEREMARHLQADLSLFLASGIMPLNGPFQLHDPEAQYINEWLWHFIEWIQLRNMRDNIITITRNSESPCELQNKLHESRRFTHGTANAFTFPPSLDLTALRSELERIANDDAAYTQPVRKTARESLQVLPTRLLPHCRFQGTQAILVLLEYIQREHCDEMIRQKATELDMLIKESSLYLRKEPIQE